MEQLWPKTGNPLTTFSGLSLFLLLLLCLPNVKNKYYHGKVSDILSAQHKEVLASVSWENVVSAHVAATASNGESLGNCFGFSLFLLILCLPNVSKKLIRAQDHINCLHNTNEDW